MPFPALSRAPRQPRPSSSEHHAAVPAIIAVAALVTVLLLLPMLLQPRDVQNYYLALVLTGLTMVPLVVRAASGTLDVFEPIIPISLLIGLAFGIRAMYIAYDPIAVLPADSVALPFIDFMEPALRLAIAAYCSLLVGYFVLAAPVRVVPLAARRFWRRTGATAPLQAWKVGGLLLLAAMGSLLIDTSDSDAVTGSTTVIGMFTALAQVTACMMALHLAAGDRRPWLRFTLGMVALPLAAWQALALGAKAYILQFFYVVIAARHYVKRRVRVALLAVAAAVLALFVFPTVNIYRDDPAQLQRLLTSITPRDYAQLTLESLLSRSTGVDTLSLVMKYDVANQLGNPEAYAYIPVYAFIPRAIWRDKPVIDQGTQFGRLLLAPSFAGAVSTASFGIFHIGDLFVSFGIAGVLVGMCVLGVVYRLTYKFFDPANTPDLAVKFLYILVVWRMVNGFESDIPSTYANLLKTLAIWTVVALWLNRPVRSTASGKGIRLSRPEPVLRSRLAR